MVYPNNTESKTEGHFLIPKKINETKTECKTEEHSLIPKTKAQTEIECSILFLAIPNETKDGKTIIQTWQKDIYSKIKKWIEFPPQYCQE